MRSGPLLQGRSLRTARKPHGCALRIFRGLVENFEQLAQSNGSDRRQHVQRDAGFGGVHSEVDRLGRSTSPEARVTAIEPRRGISLVVRHGSARRTEDASLVSPQAQRLLAAQLVSRRAARRFVSLTRRHRRRGRFQAFASFRRSPAVLLRFCPDFVCRPKYRVAAGLQ